MVREIARGDEVVYFPVGVASDILERGGFGGLLIQSAQRHYREDLVDGP